MTFKLKALAAAVMLASGSSAFAAIQDGSTGNGELYLTVWDTVGLKSYTRDLGVFMNDFGTGNRASGGFTSVIDAATGTNSVRFSSASDANWATFVGTSNPTSFIYDVVAVDSVGGTGPDALRFLSTSTTALDWAGTGGNQQSNSLISQFVLQNDYINGVNQAIGANASVIQTAADNGYAGTAAKGTQWGTKSNFISMGNVGSDLGFYYITRGGTSPAGEGISAAYGNAIGAGSWNLATDGTLTFTAPVPEPSTYAMMALGLVGLGAAVRKARGRKA